MHQQACYACMFLICLFRLAQDACTRTPGYWKLYYSQVSVCLPPPPPLSPPPPPSLSSLNLSIALSSPSLSLRPLSLSLSLSLSPPSLSRDSFTMTHLSTKTVFQRLLTYVFDCQDIIATKQQNREHKALVVQVAVLCHVRKAGSACHIVSRVVPVSVPAEETLSCSTDGVCSVYRHKRLGGGREVMYKSETMSTDYA